MLIFRALDLSQGGEMAVIYPEPELYLKQLMTNLPHLSWLDIAGTNLAGFEKPESSVLRLEAGDSHVR